MLSKVKLKALSGLNPLYFYYILYYQHTISISKAVVSWLNCPTNGMIRIAKTSKMEYAYVLLPYRIKKRRGTKRLVE